MILGFTGTRRGMTPAQRESVSWLLAGRDLAHVHHGGAIGADADFHRLILANRPDLVGTIHPCDIESQREDFTVDELRGQNGPAASQL